MNRCYFLNQKNYSFGKLTGAGVPSVSFGRLIGVRCRKEATVEEPKNGRSYHFCTVHSYTAERFVGAGAGPGYIPA